MRLFSIAKRYSDYYVQFAFTDHHQQSSYIHRVSQNTYGHIIIVVRKFELLAHNSNVSFVFLACIIFFFILHIRGRSMRSFVPLPSPFSSTPTLTR